jgi:prepilin-type N-terminal cleavage/methylation domain-containing protein
MRLYKKQAFTLIELMIVVLVLGALTAIALPRISGGAFTAGVNACRKNVDIINSQIELYHSSTNTWPLNIGTVTNDPNYFPDGPPLCPYEKPYILIKTNGRNRVPDHLHLDRTAIKKISESILEKL